MPDFLWTFVQFCVSVAAGAFVWFSPDWPPEGSRMAPVIATLITGLLANYIFMFVVTWARFGWKAARSMKMFG